jgi:3-hydroxyacyl-CoA dehydrogenase/enoyl-CoA hydratase/3-hydroxybutyryl-CoA epimerase
LEKLGVPVVGAINGSALGGGFELALACNRRIALRRDDIVIGLPEVKFGILPGAGGVVRLTRLIGLEPALAYLLSGKQVDVDSALRDGLIDEIADDEQALKSKARAFILATVHPIQPWDMPGPLGSHMLSARQRMALVMAPLHLRHGVEAEQHAAKTIVQVAAESTYLQVDAALRIETRALVELMLAPEAAHLIQTFLASRRARGAAA